MEDDGLKQQFDNQAIQRVGTKRKRHEPSAWANYVPNHVRCCSLHDDNLGLNTRGIIIKIRTQIFSRPTREKGIGDKIRLGVKQGLLAR